MKQLHSNPGSTENITSVQYLLFSYLYLLGIYLHYCSSISQWSNIGIFRVGFFFKTSLNFHSSSLQVRVRYTGKHLAIGSSHFESPQPISDKQNICLRFACWCVVPWDAHDSARPPSDRESVRPALQRSVQETNQVWLLRRSLPMLAKRQNKLNDREPIICCSAVERENWWRDGSHVLTKLWI